MRRKERANSEQAQAQSKQDQVPQYHTKVNQSQPIIIAIPHNYTARMTDVQFNNFGESNQEGQTFRHK
jgi:hypothetical protein